MLDLSDVAPSVPTGPLPTDLLGTIAQYGLLGVLFVLVVYALVKRDKDLTEERKARLADALAMRDLIRADTEAKVAGIKLQEEHNRLMDTIARNQEALVATVHATIAELKAAAK